MSYSIPYSLFEEWNKSLEEDVPKRSDLHSRNKALFLLWEDASHSRRDDAEALERMVGHRYRFEWESFYIPLEDSQNAVHRQIVQFTNQADADSSLALIYYSGNGRVKHGHPFWLPDSRLQPEIDWFPVQESLENSPCDVVLILDCGYRTGSSKGGQSDGVSWLRSVSPAPVGRMEILAAPSSISPDDAAFRKALIKTLADASGEPIRIDQLRRNTYRILGNALDPQYVNLSRGSNHSSIAILPSEKVNLDITIDGSMNSGNHLGLKAWADRAPRQIKTFKFLVPEEKSRDGLTKHVSVQMDVARLNDLSEKNISSWTKLAPPYVVDISIQGSVLSIREKSGDEQLNGIIQMWNQSSGFRTDLTTRDGQYKRIVVPPMKWLKDDFGDTSVISEELCELSKVFESSFDHCEVKPIYEIPAVEEPLTTVTEKIIEVKRGLESSHLLIVVYNGHGRNAPDLSGECILLGQGDDAEINWNAVQSYLYEAPCDVAQVLDCCYAGNAIKTKPQGRNEILAACEGNVTTPNGPNSYMKRFTAALSKLVNEAKPFSLSTVHERIRAETMQRNNTASKPIPLPVYKLISDNSDSITLRPRVLATDDEYRTLPEQGAPQGDGFLGWAYAKLPICSGDERRDWKDVGFVKILNAEEAMQELQGGG